jgi:hypothetical protein
MNQASYVKAASRRLKALLGHSASRQLVSLPLNHMIATIEG